MRDTDWNTAAEPNYDPFTAHHASSDCSLTDQQPPDPSHVHLVTTALSTTYLCNDHLMASAYNHGWASTYLTPDQLVDFSDNTNGALIQWNVSTFTPYSVRDYFQIVIANGTTPDDMADSFTNAIGFNVTYDSVTGCPTGSLTQSPVGIPRNSILFDNGSAKLEQVEIFDDAGCRRTIPGNSDVYYSNLTTPSAVVRRQFEIELSTAHVRYSMYYPPTGGSCSPGIIDPNDPTGCRFDWVNTDIVPALEWSLGQVTFGVQDYNVCKTCNPDGGVDHIDDCPAVPYIHDSIWCAPNSWHLSNFRINRAWQFNILNADIQYCTTWTADSYGTPCLMTFPRGAPANSYLKFEALADTSVSGFPPQFSLEGTSFQDATLSFFSQTFIGGYPTFYPYRVPIPAGTTQVWIRGVAPGGYPFHARNFAIWAP